MNNIISRGGGSLQVTEEDLQRWLAFELAAHALPPAAQAGVLLFLATSTALRTPNVN